MKKVYLNPLVLFIFRLILSTILSITISFFLVYYYNQYKMSLVIKERIANEKLIFSHNMSDISLKHIYAKAQNRKDLVSLQIYNNRLQKIINIKKEPYSAKLKKILDSFTMISKTTQYKLIPLNEDDIYIYFQTQTIENKQHYFLNILLKLDENAVALIHKDVKQTVLIIILTIFIVFIFVFPIIYKEYKLLQKQHNQLLQSRINTLISLGNAIAKRDSDTSEHNYRVTYYSIKLAEALHLPKGEIQSLIKGAFLHDIGKIGISDSILLKAGKLSRDEFEIMKTHVLYGMEIIHNDPWLKDARDIILHHHEKVDGSGYPRGIKGRKISFNAKIFAVIDVFDALTSQRPYKEAYSIEKSLQIIEDGIGKHFDKDIAKVFIKISPALYKKTLNLNTQELKEIFYENIKPYFHI